MNDWTGQSGRPANRAEVERLLDAMFADELDDAGADRLSDAVLCDANAARDAARTRWLIESLRKRPAAPDLTHNILDAVGARRPWATPRVARLVRIGRVAAVFALLAALSGALVARRVAPEVVMPGATGGPLTNLVEHGGVEVADGVRTVLGVVRTFRPVPAPGTDATAFTVGREQSAPAPGAYAVWHEGAVAIHPTPFRLEPNQPRTLWFRAAPSEGVEARVALFRAR